MQQLIPKCLSKKLLTLSATGNGAAATATRTTVPAAVDDKKSVLTAVTQLYTRKLLKFTPPVSALPQPVVATLYAEASPARPGSVVATAVTNWYELMSCSFAAEVTLVACESTFFVVELFGNFVTLSKK